jgi:hypothetical protein
VEKSGPAIGFEGGDASRGQAFEIASGHSGQKGRLVMVGIERICEGLTLYSPFAHFMKPL